jgi:transcriptional regulator with XRE-family HTH domain
LISLAQIKAARALLDWTQDRLAKAAGLSLPGVNNLERGLTSPRKETLAAIETALDKAGIEFIDTTGVRLKTPDLKVEIIEGPDWLETYDRDIMAALHGPEDELVQVSRDERQWIIYAGVTNHLYVEHRKKTGFRERLLVPDTVAYITGLPEVYRTLDPALFGFINYQVYADRFALILWDSRKVILTRSQTVADNFRAQFNWLWDQAKPFTKSQLEKLERWDGN